MYAQTYYMGSVKKALGWAMAEKTNSYLHIARESYGINNL